MLPLKQKIFNKIYHIEKKLAEDQLSVCKIMTATNVAVLINAIPFYSGYR